MIGPGTGGHGSPGRDSREPEARDSARRTRRHVTRRTRRIIMIVNIAVTRDSISAASRRVSRLAGYQYYY